jgi:hypothetical protein
MNIFSSYQCGEVSSEISITIQKIMMFVCGKSTKITHCTLLCCQVYVLFRRIVFQLRMHYNSSFLSIDIYFIIILALAVTLMGAAQCYCKDCESSTAKSVQYRDIQTSLKTWYTIIHAS